MITRGTPIFFLVRPDQLSDAFMDYLIAAGAIAFLLYDVPAPEAAQA
jgi:hypothetical protein